MQDVPITDRFLEFTTRMFRNNAYQALYRSVICATGFELCKPEHQARLLV